MNEELHRRLVSVARLGRYVIYSEIAPLLGLDMSSPADRTESAAFLEKSRCLNINWGIRSYLRLLSIEITYSGSGFLSTGPRFGNI